jgi:hypothetical protein
MISSRSLEDRARSYLDANCAQCHRPRGTVAYFDARYDTPLAQQNLIGGHVLIDERIDNSRVIAPNDIWRSILYMRTDTTEAFKMPPLARNTIDEAGMKLCCGNGLKACPARRCCRRRKFRRAVEIMTSRWRCFEKRTGSENLLHD